jgi:hypothetical protein
MNTSVIYQIVRFGVPSSAGHFLNDGRFIQVFPSKRVYKTKTDWAHAWHIFGDETLVMSVRPRDRPRDIQLSYVPPK